MRRTAGAALVAGGIAAGSAAADPGEARGASLDSAWFDHLTSSTAGGVFAAVLGFTCALVLTRTRPTVGVGLCGAAALVVAALPLSGTATFVLSIVGAGLVLGALARLATGPAVRADQAHLVAGVLIGVLCAPLVSWAADFPVPRRYADYLDEASALEPSWWLLIWALLAVAALATAANRREFAVDAARSGTVDGRAAIIGIAAPLVALGLYVWFVEAVTGASGLLAEPLPSQWLGYVLAAAVAAVAVWVPGRVGAVVVLAVALLAARSVLGSWTPNSLWWLLVPIAGVGVGAWAGYARPNSRAAFAVVVLCAAAGLLREPPLDNVQAIVAMIVFPAAAAYAIASVLPTAPTTLTTALAVPFATAAAVGNTFGWTAWNGESPQWAFVPHQSGWWQWVAVGALLVVCALALHLVRRRPVPE
ncbi:hypothetical protein [Rhodococcus sp. HNM0569]|uniref:hypothetical protein n=1 Tax=Rhodococcus sp. HNM0569 TaxID=2716340 RepID=UPI00146CD728|nr:hypothetical protein [Rhodococcus sp. HNM0569]NLU83567.1 hypothetical protein [Rhodococcus sp. HNM0569]